MAYKVIATRNIPAGVQATRLNDIGNNGYSSIDFVGGVEMQLQTPSPMETIYPSPAGDIGGSGKFRSLSPWKITDRSRFDNSNDITKVAARQTHFHNGHAGQPELVERSSARVEGSEWWTKKGALFVFPGSKADARERPALTLYFQRFPTEYSYVLESKLSEQNIPGQSGTNIQKMGSASAVYSTQLLFHDAWLGRDQVTTATGLKLLNQIVREGWRYKVMWTIGASVPIPIVIKGIKVNMSNFIAAGAEQRFHAHSLPEWSDGVSRYTMLINEGKQDRKADDPQRAEVDLEFIEDLSKDVVVPFVKRVPPRTGKKTPAPGSAASPASPVAAGVRPADFSGVDAGFEGDSVLSGHHGPAGPGALERAARFSDGFDFNHDPNTQLPLGASMTAPADQLSMLGRSPGGNLLNSPRGRELAGWYRFEAFEGGAAAKAHLKTQVIANPKK
jgi:hypothetical protein